MLVDTSFELATNNVKQHIMTSSFPPTIADVAREVKEVDENPYSDHKIQTQQHMLLLEEVQRKAVPMPESIRRLLQGG